MSEGRWEMKRSIALVFAVALVAAMLLGSMASFPWK